MKKIILNIIVILFVSLRVSAQQPCISALQFVFNGVELDGSNMLQQSWHACLNENCNIVASYSKPNGIPVTLTWNWGDGSPVSTGNNVNHVYNGTGNWNITITATGPCGTVVAHINVTISMDYCAKCCYYNDNLDPGSPWNRFTSYSGIDNFGRDVIESESIITASVKCPKMISLAIAECPNATITWDWGDGTPNSSGSSVSHYYAAGTYILQITVGQNLGSPGTAACVGWTKKVRFTVSKVNCADCCTKTKNFMTPGNFFTFTSPVGSTELVADACKGSQLVFNANCPNATNYLWDFGDGSAQATGASVVHTYAPYLTNSFYMMQVTIDGPSCKTVVESVKVNIDLSHCPPCCVDPFATSSSLKNLAYTSDPLIINAAACPNTMMLFTAVCPFSTNYTWNWGDNTPNSTGAPVAHSYNSSGTYAITVTPEGQGCIPYPQTINLTISNNYCPPCCIDAFVTGNVQNLSLTNTPLVLTAQACQRSPVTFTAACPGATGTNYTWNFGDGATATGPTASHQYAGSGNFVVTVTSPGGVGCGPTIETINLQVSNTLCEPCCQLTSFINSNDLLNLTETSPGVFNAQLCAGKSVNLDALTCNPGVTPTYIWVFGDGGVSGGASVAHTYATAGNYVLDLSVTGAGCYQNETMNLTVVDCSCSGATIIGPSSGGCIDYPVLLSVGGCKDPGAIYNWSFGDGTTATGSPVTHVYSGAGNYNVSLTIIHPPYSPVTITSNLAVTTCPALNVCKDCIGSFSPEPGEYILSLWVKQNYNYPLSSFPDPAVKVSFVGSSVSYGPIYPNPAKNKVMDGWQRIEEKVTVPIGATSIKLELFNFGLNDCFFDDIRFHPVNASMKSYVYDPVTLRLSAELDENNYATYFEYDEDGKLVRVKKETERGIMTIKEARNSSKK